MWIVWFTLGFIVGLCCKVLMDLYFCDQPQQQVLRYIPRLSHWLDINLKNINNFCSARISSIHGQYQTWIESYSTERSSANGLLLNPQRSISSVSSRGAISNLSGQGKSSKKTPKITSPRRKFASSEGPVQTSLLPSNPHSFTEEIPSSPGWLQTPNVAFYQNKIPAKPNHECIEEILTTWAGDYGKLMENCHYIQWLFPNRMPGINKEAHILTDEEALIIEDTPVLRERVKRAFEMMLDFYGMTLTWNNQIQLSETPKKRLKQLNQKDNHHFLCITRILLALKELGHHNLMLPWMKCLADLIYKENRLNHARFSFENHWINILDAADRIQLSALINSYNI